MLKDDHSEGPDLSKALELTQKFEQHNMFRLWTVYLLANGIISLLSEILNQIYLVFSDDEFSMYFSPLDMFQIMINGMLILIILFLIWIVTQKKQTLLEEGTLVVKTNRKFVGLIFIFTPLPWIFGILYTIIAWGTLIDKWGIVLYTLTASMTFGISYLIMRKLVSLHHFRELLVSFLIMSALTIILFIGLVILQLDINYGWVNRTENFLQYGNPYYQYNIIHIISSLTINLCKLGGALSILPKTRQVLA